MYTEVKQEMKLISEYAGQRKDYVQGGGGNTSVKFDNRLMGIKASGYCLNEITEGKGYVTVNYKKIKQYYNTVDVEKQKDFEKESLQVNLDSIVLLDGMENKRPSVEVGFHSFLQKYVIHTHSVYANVLCCCEQGQKIAQEIFRDNSISYLFVPYIDPGFRLTFAVKKAVEAFQAEKGIEPDVIFLKNHGMIVSNDDAKKVISIHETVNERIKSYLTLPNYTQPKIKKSGQVYKGDTDYLKRFITQNNVDTAYLKTLRLYPDQLVYIGSKLDKVIKIDVNTAEITYHTTAKEAQVIEETLVGVAYVINEIKKTGLILKQMNEADADFINNWEGEKYRSKLVI